MSGPKFLRSMILLFVLACSHSTQRTARTPRVDSARIGPFFRTLVAAAREQTQHRVRYDGSYRQIPYPGGDVPDSIGVCTDVIIRAYRKVGIDLQKEVHEVLGMPDTNIDHRRVPNLMRLFASQGRTLLCSRNGLDYAPGDIVVWRQWLVRTHIGIVSDRPSKQDSTRFLVIHNNGPGPKEEDALFRWPVKGHYRYWRDRDTLEPDGGFGDSVSAKGE